MSFNRRKSGSWQQWGKTKRTDAAQWISHMLRWWCYILCVCVCAHWTQRTLLSCCVWLTPHAHRDTHPIKSEEINTPLPFISFLALSRFLAPWLPDLMFCGNDETLCHFAALGRSFTSQNKKKKPDKKTVTEKRKPFNDPPAHTGMMMIPPTPDLHISPSLTAVMSLKWNTVLLFTISIRIESPFYFPLWDPQPPPRPSMFNVCCLCSRNFFL